MSGRMTTLFIAAALLSGCGGRLSAIQGDPAGRRADLEAFRQQFFDVDHSYSPAARAEAEYRLQALAQQLDRLSDVQFITRLTQIVALADNGHTMMLFRGTNPELGLVPIRLLPFGDQFYVARAGTRDADLVGGRLLAIDGHPFAQLRDSARTLSGGIPAWRDRAAAYLFESPGQLHALGLARAGGGATYRFALSGGRVIERTLQPGAPLPGDDHDPITPLDPDVPAGVVSMLPLARAPWSLRDFTTLVRRRDAPELDAVVIQMHGNFNPPGGSIAASLESADSFRRALHRHNVILDMRFNGGGNLQLTRQFMVSLPGRVAPDGRVFVLTSPWTFSAAISSTGYIKQAGGASVVLVGEPVGDRLQFWAEGRPIELPHSGALILPATQRHDYLTGCKPFTDCHSYMVRFPIEVRSLTPDIPAPWTAEAYAAGRDPAMEAVARAIHSAARGN
jgi:hypothetical protein